VALNITQNEKRIPDPATWGCVPGCNFQTNVLKWFRAAKEETERSQREPKRVRGEQGGGGGAQKKAAGGKQPPIILLPRSESAVLNMRNGLEFFEKGIFVAEQEDLSKQPPKEFNVTCVACHPRRICPSTAALTHFSRPFPPPHPLSRRYNGCKFIVKDVSACTMTEWLQRVVALVVMGNTWQVRCRCMLRDARIPSLLLLRSLPPPHLPLPVQ